MSAWTFGGGGLAGGFGAKDRTLLNALWQRWLWFTGGVLGAGVMLFLGGGRG